MLLGLVLSFLWLWKWQVSSGNAHVNPLVGERMWPVRNLGER